jgi:hypothetical protein
MKPVLPAVLGIPAGELSRLAGLPPWLVITVVAASLVLGLAGAVIPQDSADRLHLLLTLHGCRPRAEITPGTTVTGHVMEDQEADAPTRRDHGPDGKIVVTLVPGDSNDAIKSVRKLSADEVNDLTARARAPKAATRADEPCTPAG